MYNNVLHITVNHLHGGPIISHNYTNVLFYPLNYDIISLTGLKITQEFHLLLGFTENQITFGILKFEIAFR